MYIDTRRIGMGSMFVGFLGVLALFYFDSWAVGLSLYFHYSWLDLLVHTSMGGFLCVLVFGMFTVYVGKLQSVGIASMALVLLAAVVWEVLELLFARTYWSPLFALDTSTDVVATCFGAFIALYFLKKGRVRHRTIPNSTL